MIINPRTQEQSQPSTHYVGYYSIPEAMRRLSLSNEKELHLLIQARKLRAGFRGGQYMIDAESLRNYVMGVNN
jgi:hypothetical protein